MKIEGESAAEHHVIRLDSFSTVNDGVLLAADDETGFVKWKDKSDTEKSVTLGVHAIRIMAGRK